LKEKIVWENDEYYCDFIFAEEKQIILIPKEALDVYNKIDSIRHLVFKRVNSGPWKIESFFGKINDFDELIDRIEEEFNNSYD
jgi:hypothetical protein